MRSDLNYYLAEVEIDEGAGRLIDVVRRFKSSADAVKWIIERRAKPDATGLFKLDFVTGKTQKVRNCDHLVTL